ncbi:MAG: tetratricopeptide repeat protein [Polyangiaceae bacterium]|nr:tetratricopeptide repeat protein [Polyangiaceae bacterium]
MKVTGAIQGSVVLALALLLSACDGPPRADAATATAPPPAATASPAANAEHALATADPGGDAAVDQLIRSYVAAAKKSDRAEDWVLLGRAWIRKARETADAGYYLHARACAEAVLSRDPEHSMALDLLGLTQLSQHRFEDALSTADRVLAMKADQIAALGNKSDALLELGRYDEAIAAASSMVDLKPSLPSYSRASYLSWLSGDEKAALESARLAIESANDPTDPEPRCYAMVQAAAIFLHKGDYEGADIGYQRALKDCPDYPPALLGRGRAALALGKADAAVTYLSAAKKGSRSIEILWRLGDALEASGKKTEAEEMYVELIKRGEREDPRTVAQFLATKGRDLEKAIALATAEMKERPGIYTEDALAWSLFKAGRTDEAAVLAARSARLGTRDAALLYHAGAIAMKRGDDKGRGLVERALELSPAFDPTGVREARALLGRD